MATFSDDRRPPRRWLLRETAAVAARVYRGFPTGEPDLYDNMGRRLSIRVARPTHIMLDGDILEPTDRCEVDVPFRVTLVCG